MYYQIFADNIEIPSKVFFDPGEPSIGCIRADSVVPPHSLSSIKRRISRVEETPALVNADVFADISADSPLKEGPISIHGTDGPGLSPDKPMAIIQVIPDGKYIIKNRTADIFWNAGKRPIEVVYFYSEESVTLVKAKNYDNLHVRSILHLPSDQKITFFRSGTSHMIRTVTSSWYHHMLHPHGLVSMLLGLRCQFLGD